jgi:predicted TPR repeat methyltransferase
MNTSASTTTASHFDTAARDWDQRPMSQQLAAVPPRLLAHLPLAPTDHVLDFGAGTGLLATQIAPRVAQVTALDMSGAMLQVLADKGFANITPHQGDIFAACRGATTPSSAAWPCTTWPTPPH